ncbi:MAG TPA: porphobilinogen synthase [Pontiellaceae bacterium]|nr:porphobilinogen synthase [Pontiellaceae bacterium]HPR83011.1 porphobilinogen synthase [Pontiellaceae bacterium]
MFPEIRLRRLRRTEGLRRMLGQPLPGPEKFIWPVFIREGKGVDEAISAMPGQSRMSVDVLLKRLKPVAESGVGGVLLFGLTDPAKKDANGSEAFNEKGAVQKAIPAIKKAFPQLTVFTDVCLCAYTDHGHCGPLNAAGEVDNDAALTLLQKVAVSHAQAGADCVAPSAMMDGQVLAIREALDEEELTDTLLMSYSSKFASAMYGPFREAEQSAPGKGDRQSYQASYSDLRTALRESEFDEDEGADILMVKPAMMYLDVIHQLRETTDLPVAAYNVSGEYSMLIAQAERGWGDLRAMVRENMAAMQRAGTGIFISYWASRYNELLKD